MTARLIDGRQLAAQFKEQVRQSIDGALSRGRRRPGLAVVKVGDNLIESVITRTSAEELALKKGDVVRVVIKSTEVMIQKG